MSEFPVELARVRDDSCCRVEDTLQLVGRLPRSANQETAAMFGTTDMNIIKDCQAYFGTQPPSEILTKRRCKFLEQ